METKDLYKVLELSKGASQEEIRRSYRRLARKYHPDANRGDKEAEARAEERFKEVQHAYEILSNPEKRREYDEGPRAFFGGGGAPGGSGTTRVNANLSDFTDLFGNFGDIFGGAGATAGRSKPRAGRGEDMTVSVNLRFKDALEGAVTRIAVPVEEACGPCRGTGAAAGTAPRPCPACSGRGVRSRDQGFFALSQPCASCGGEGTVVESPCSSCGGAGRVRKDRQVTVRVPAGAKDGMKIRVPGRGGTGRRGGPPGDLYVVTRVEEHPVFERSGDDFVVDVPVSFVEAALGAEIEVPRPGGGTVRLRLPSGAQDGKRLKVRGAGAPKVQAPRAKGGPDSGDLVVRVRVVVPEGLNKREREILRALAEERDENVREELLRLAEQRASS